jgi:hypothetical protein
MSSFSPPRRVHLLVAPLVALLTLSLLGGCPKHHDDEVEEGGPGRPVMVEQLTALAAMIEAGDEVGVRARLAAPPEMPEPQVLELVRGLIKQGGVTVAGARALATVGSYGSVKRVFRIAGPKEAKALGLDPEACFGLKHKDTEVLGHWDGKQFRFFRLDNIGKAAAAVEAAPVP